MKLKIERSVVFDLDGLNRFVVVLLIGLFQ